MRPLTLPARPVVPFAVRLTQQQSTALETLAVHLDCSRSTLARLALARGLEQLQEEHAA